MEQWDEGYYITAVAGAQDGNSLVIMSKVFKKFVIAYNTKERVQFKYALRIRVVQGTPYSQQSYKVSDSFPFKWINKKWKEGFFVTSMATAGM